MAETDCPECKHETPTRFCSCSNAAGGCSCQALKEAEAGKRDCVFVCLERACCFESCRHEAVYDGLCATHLEQQELVKLLDEAANRLLDLPNLEDRAFARRLLKKAKALTHYSTYAQLRRVVQQIRRKNGPQDA